MSTVSTVPSEARNHPPCTNSGGAEGVHRRLGAERSWGEALVTFDPGYCDSGLDPDELSQLRHRLLGLVDELVDRIAAIKAVRRRPGGQTDDTVAPILADRVRLHENSIEETAAALAAIDAGVYGICLRCRRSIGFDVLWAEPMTMTCLEPRADSAMEGVR